MLLKKSLRFVFVVTFSFAAVSAVGAQESANDIMRRFSMPENCQDAISRFPVSLQGGFQGVYITFTGYMDRPEQEVFNQMVLFHLLNYVKTNIILTGKGNEKREGADDTYSQFYTTTRVQAIQAAAMYQLSVSMFGNPGGTNWNVWTQRLMEWL